MNGRVSVYTLSPSGLALDFVALALGPQGASYRVDDPKRCSALVTPWALDLEDENSTPLTGEPSEGASEGASKGPRSLKLTVADTGSSRLHVFALEVKEERAASQTEDEEGDDDQSEKEADETETTFHITATQLSSYGVGVPASSPESLDCPKGSCVLVMHASPETAEEAQPETPSASVLKRVVVVDSQNHGIALLGLETASPRTPENDEP